RCLRAKEGAPRGAEPLGPLGVVATGPVLVEEPVVRDEEGPQKLGGPSGGPGRGRRVRHVGGTIGISQRPRRGGNVRLYLQGRQIPCAERSSEYSPSWSSSSWGSPMP